MTESAAKPAPPPRSLPSLSPLNRAFWTGGEAGQLLIQRCDACSTYVHPPRVRCPRCHGAALGYSPVSGRGRVATFTVNRQQWVKGLSEPFVFAVVELEEQAELYVFSNIAGCPVDDVDVGQAVEVFFEQNEEVFLPMFRPVEERA